MQRLIYIFFAAVIILAISMLAFMTTRPQSGIDEKAVRVIVSEMLVKTSSDGQVFPLTNQINQKTLDPMIEEYLLNNPDILIAMSNLLQQEQENQTNAQTGEALVEMYDEIYNDPDNIILGNPNGDVTLVEFFDYNCPFCAQVMPHITSLIDADPNLRVIIKEFPVLGKNSEETSAISLAFYKAGGDYWAFHEKLFAIRGTITAKKALDIAQDMGVNRASLELSAASEDINRIIQNSYAIAQKLNINGTPAFIIGDEIIPGAVDLEQLELRIKNMRECNKTQC